MMCPCCDAGLARVTLTTPVGVHSVCASCAIQGGNTQHLSALNEVTWLEHLWLRDSSRVKGDGYVSRRP